MANTIYPLYKEALLQRATDTDILNGAVRVVLVDTGAYTYSAAHQYLTDLTGIVATQLLPGPKSVTGGVFDAGDVTFSSVTGVTIEAIVLYIDTGVAATSRLVAYIDTGVTGLPATPNSGNIFLIWDNGANRVFAL